MTTVKTDDGGLRDEHGVVPDHALALLGLVMDRFRRDLGERAAAGGTLRSSQLRLLSLTPAAGLRVTDLAERVGMTKQALGEFANELEARGLLESVRDPADRRVRVLRPTPSGLDAVAAGSRAIAEIEGAWRARLGAERWAQLRALLTEAAVDPARAVQSEPEPSSRR